MSIVRTNQIPHRITYRRDHYQETSLGGVVTVDANTQSVLANELLANYVSKDMVKRDWKRLISRGQNATTYLTGRKYACDFTEGESYLRIRRKALVSGKVQIRTYVTKGVIRAISNPGTPTGASLTAADNIAKARFVKAARSAQTQFMGLQHLAEAREAIRMLRGDTKTIAKHTRRYLDDVKRLVLGLSKRKGKRRPFGRTPGDRRVAQSAIANRYLQYAYGVSPLVGTTQDAGETLARIHMGYNNPHRMVVGTGSASTSSIQSHTREVYGVRVFDSVITDKHTSVVIYRGVVGTSLDQLSGVNRMLGLDLSQFVPTLWEVIPWSFVADYVTNIGDIVDAASFPRSTLKWVARTQVLSVERSLAMEVEEYWDPALWTLEGRTFVKPKCVWRNRLVGRDTYTGSLVPDLTFGIGEVKGSWRKQLNLAALARQNGSVLRLINRIFIG